MAVPEYPSHGVPDSPNRGLTALVRTTGYLIDEFALEITFFGREGLAVRDTCNACLEGRHLTYELTMTMAGFTSKRR